MRELPAFWAIRSVWMRYFDVFRKKIVYSLMTTYLEPLLYLVSFGFGLGGMIGDIQVAGVTVPYRKFILAGMLGQTLLFQAFFEAGYGGFIRMYYQRIFKAMAMTPVTLGEVLWAELIWVASKATFASVAILIIGVAIGDFSPVGSLLSLPICFMGGVIFAAVGMASAAKSSTIEDLSYPQYLLIFPMFLFCGVFFPIDKLPEVVQYVAWVFPLTPLVASLRQLVIGLPAPAWSPFLLLLWMLILVPLSRRMMLRRLIQ